MAKAETVYLDNQATTACDPAVLAAMLPWFERCYGNPHSAEHFMGHDAEAAVEQARVQVAGLIGAEAREIIFTSGATESNNLAIKGAAAFARRHGDGRRRRVITLQSEHKCVLESVASLAEDGFEPIVLPVRSDGRLDLGVLQQVLVAPTLLVSVMTANNEIGTVQNIAAIAAAAREAGALFHTDAAQAVGKMKLGVEGIDLLSISGHKLYGPKGIGALYVRRRPRVRLAPILSGGGQERGLRPGTLPTPLVVGLGVACDLAKELMIAEAGRVASLRDDLLRRLRAGIAGLTVNGTLDDRLPGNLNLTFPAASAEALMRALPWLCVSTGSACSSATIEPSYVLRAIGVGAAAAARTLRLGLGRSTSQAEITRVADALIAAHAALARSPEALPA